MRKPSPRKLSLQRETLKHLSASQLEVRGGRPPFTQGAPTCTWYSELYSACTCPPSWHTTCEPLPEV